MKDVSAPLKSKLLSLIGTTGYEVYSDYAPHTVGDSYYLISDILDTETSTMNSTDTQPTFTIGIYTRRNIGISANTSALMASALFDVLYPEIDLSPDFQAAGLAKVGDRQQTLEINSAICINRFITFRIENVNH